MIGAYLDAARLLGVRTGELHVALSSGPERQDFAPEPYSTLYQRSMYQSMRNVAGRVMRRLKAELPTLPEDARESAEALVAKPQRIVEVFDAFLRRAGKRSARQVPWRPCPSSVPLYRQRFRHRQLRGGLAAHVGRPSSQAIGVT